MSPRAPQSVVSSPRAQASTASTASTVRSPERAPLAQHYGFKPGTYMIGQFGTTAEARASMVPNDNPGPGAYDPAVTALGHPRGMSPRVGSLEVVHHSDTSWGSDPIPSNRVAAVRDRTPAPGVHGAEVPSDGSILTKLIRRWPNRVESSAFGRNAEPTPSAVVRSAGPGVGAYEPEHGTLFATNSLGGGHGGRGTSPFVPEARRAVGSRKRIASDTKATSSFASTSSREPTKVGTVSPGPTAYTLPAYFDVLAAKTARKVALRGTRNARESSRGFDTSEERMRRLPLDGSTDADNPSPAAHAVPRPSQAPITSHHRPRTSPQESGQGFLSSALRMPPSGGAVVIGHMPTPGPGRYATDQVARTGMAKASAMGYPSFNTMQSLGGYVKPGVHAADMARRRRLAQEQAMHLRSPTMQQPVRAVHSRDAPQGHEVVAYLASGGGGAPGTSLQRQALMRLLREAAAAADSEGAVSV